MSPKPTIVFVAGAWHGPELWDKVSTLLEEQDYRCVAVALPTTQSTAAGISDDVKAVRHAIEAETSQGRDVVVVAHSYGGVVGPSAIKDLTAKTDAQGSSFGCVRGLVMMATGFMPTGVGFLEAGGGTPPPIWRVDEESGLAVITVEPRELFYHDIPEEEGDEWVSKLRKQSLKAFTDGTDVYAGWQDVPVWYLATVDDKAFPGEAQKMVLQMAKDTMGAKVTMSRDISAGHSPMLSKPGEVAGFISEAAQAFSSGDGDA
ncbi:Alpha/beta hydrolase fold-1 [Apodospora peruviana]|uniref:Alpha/beta hydrolase fold-1 n=1 Tax=Apodospora peruviana TaxID=516989 RepID=A0AAE0LZ18_9PEZI|nr:Alpha/beta hydrolase fold-1 [Apodospora peruviana]